MEQTLARNLGLDLVRATEAAAVAAGPWVGRGMRREPEEAANLAMADALNHLNMDGTIVIGEQSKVDTLPVLTTGRHIGNGRGPQVDIVLDAVDALSMLVENGHGAISVAAVAPRGTLWAPADATYMDKLVVDRDVAHAIVPECLDAPVAWTLALIARVKGVKVNTLTVYLLDRPRHRDLIDEVRAAGARVMLRRDGDISGALRAATVGASVDLLLGTGGVSEGIIAACAVKALGGAMLGRLAPQSSDERHALSAAGFDPTRIMSCDEMVATDQIFFAATGVTEGSTLHGLRFEGNRVITESLVLRGKTRTKRLITTEHLLPDYAT